MVHTQRAGTCPVLCLAQRVSARSIYLARQTRALALRPPPQLCAHALHDVLHSMSTKTRQKIHHTRANQPTAYMHVGCLTNRYENTLETCSSKRGDCMSKQPTCITSPYIASWPSAKSTLCASFYFALKPAFFALYASHLKPHI